MTQNSMDQRTQNQPSHDTQVKGGQHSQQNQGNTGQSGDRSQNQPPKQGQFQQPSHEEQVKGGQQSHSGSSNR
jgi:hypothetical protein